MAVLPLTAKLVWGVASDFDVKANGVSLGPHETKRSCEAIRTS